MALSVILLWFAIPSVGMTIYHAYLVIKNLTTNKVQNKKRYSYLLNDNGKYHNPFDAGPCYNIHNQFFPSLYQEATRFTKDSIQRDSKQNLSYGSKETVIDSYVTLV